MTEFCLPSRFSRYLFKTADIYHIARTICLGEKSVRAQAYGPDGLGILTVSGVPGFAELRQRLLPLAQAFAVRQLLISNRLTLILMHSQLRKDCQP